MRRGRAQRCVVRLLGCRPGFVYPPPVFSQLPKGPMWNEGRLVRSVPRTNGSGECRVKHGVFEEARAAPRMRPAAGRPARHRARSQPSSAVLTAGSQGRPVLCVRNRSQRHESFSERRQTRAPGTRCRAPPQARTALGGGGLGLRNSRAWFADPSTVSSLRPPA